MVRPTNFAQQSFATEVACHVQVLQNNNAYLALHLLTVQSPLQLVLVIKVILMMAPTQLVQVPHHSYLSLQLLMPGLY
jgi:hypothetical protein